LHFKWSAKMHRSARPSAPQKQIVFALNCLATVSDYHIPHNYNISK
jgi:hypothetical protein